MNRKIGPGKDGSHLVYHRRGGATSNGSAQAQSVIHRRRFQPANAVVVHVRADKRFCAFQMAQLVSFGLTIQYEFQCCVQFKLDVLCPFIRLQNAAEISTALSSY